MKRILLVEDDPRDVELTLEALAEHNLASEAEVVRDGAEALDYLWCRGRYEARGKSQPAVVLLDLKLPKVNGIEVLGVIKSDDDLKVIPVVVLTSSKEEQDIVECYKRGANGYVVKPVDFHEFFRAVSCIGLYWAIANEPPPGSYKKRI